MHTPSDFKGKVAGELNAALEADKRELLDLVGFFEFLCCLSILDRERVAGRVAVSQERAAAVVRLVSSMGLHCRRSDFDLLPQPDLVGANFKHNCVYVRRDSRVGAWAILYIGLDEEFARGAEAAELNKEQRLVGHLFGYPECCSEFFLQGDGVNQDRTAASVADAGPFPSILNPALNELYGFSLQFHFACSPRCTRSLALAKGRLSSLRRYMPSIIEVEKLGAGITIYGPTTGAVLVTRYRSQGDDLYEVEEVTTWNEKAAELFAADGSLPRVRLNSAHEFQIGGKTLKDDSHFAAVFTESTIQ